MEKVARFNRMWIDHAAAAPAGRALLVRYEGLRSACASELSRIVTFLGATADRDRIVRTAEENRFETMRARERSGDYAARYGAIFGSTNPADPNSYKVRSGKINTYMDEMSDLDISYCDQIMRQYRL